MGRFKMIACGVLVAALLGTTGYVLTKDSTVADHTAEETMLVLKTNTKQDQQSTDILEKNKHNAINMLIQNFYNQKADEQKFADTYQNIDVYSKRASKSDDYIVYASYEMKIKDVETPVPGLESFYVSKLTNGTYQITDVSMNQNLQQEILDASKTDDVQTLIQSVERRYIEAKEIDAVLYTALEDLQTVYQ